MYKFLYPVSSLVFKSCRFDLCQSITFSFKTLTRNLKIATVLAKQFNSAVSLNVKQLQLIQIDRRKLLKISVHPAYPLILLRRLLKTAATLLPLVEMALPFIISKIWPPTHTDCFCERITVIPFVKMPYTFFFQFCFHFIYLQSAV